MHTVTLSAHLVSVDSEIDRRETVRTNATTSRHIWADVVHLENLMTCFIIFFLAGLVTWLTKHGIGEK